MTLTLTLTAACARGNHLTFGVSGDRQATLNLMRDDMVEPITDEEAAAFVKVLVKMAKAGRTNAQARALLEAGVTVTV